MITQAQLLALSRHADSHIVAAITAHAAEVLPRHQITTPLRLQHFIAQIDVESQGFTKLFESLDYSADRLHQVWPGRFPTIAAAAPWAHHAQALANHVYGGRMGNTGQNDGWLNRGQGLLQQTGHDNLTWLAKLLDVSLDEARRRLTAPETMLDCAAAIFVARGCLPLADRDDVAGVSRAINGGTNGLAERTTALRLCKTIFKEI